jgi:hypothetical protein
MDHAKLRVIEDWEEPRIFNEVRSFLGLDNYYCRFLEGFSNIFVPLIDLLKKNKLWIWLNKCREAFFEPCWRYYTLTSNYFPKFYSPMLRTLP